MASPARRPPFWTLIQFLRVRAHPDDPPAETIKIPTQVPLMNTTRFLAAAWPTILLLALCSSPGQGQFARYKPTLLPLINLVSLDLNDSTEIVGMSTSGPVKWRKGILTPLPTLDGTSYPVKINNASQVVGTSLGTDIFHQRATYWPTSGSVVSLGTLPGDHASTGTAINSQGAIIGISIFNDTANHIYRYTPFLYEGTLTSLPGQWGSDYTLDATSINDSGYILVISSRSPARTWVYRRTASVALIPNFIGRCISKNNEVFGGTYLTYGRAAYWKDGIVTVLPGPPGSWANDIDSTGTIVGACYSNYLHGIIWKKGEWRYLDSLVDRNYMIYQGVAINEKGEILCTGRFLTTMQECAILLTPGGQVAVPQKNATWIAGEVDTIRWGGIARGTSLLIEFSSDSGRTFQALAAGVPSDSDKYAWQIPKDVLSTRCFLRLRENSTLDSLAVSEQFKIKPYQLTRIDPATGDYVAYTVPRNQWGFWNREEDMWPYLYWYSRFSYNGGMDPFTGQPFPSWEAGLPFGNANDSDYPSWVSFVKSFTVDACYISLPLAVYSQAAVERWGWARDSWGGSCFGIAGTNALAFSFRESFLNRYPGFPLVGNPISVMSDTSVISAVSEIYTHQFGKPSTYNDLACALKTPKQTLNDLRQMLRENTTQIRTITISDDGPQGGAHTILAYKVDRTADDSPIWNVHVYDNSYPNEPDAIIEIDTSQNFRQGTWGFKYGTYGANGWGGKEGIYLEVPSENYLSLPTLGKRLAGPLVFHLTPGRLEIGGTRDASIRIRDEVGNVTGCAGGQVWSDIPGSVPLMVKNGSPGPPYGYALASGSYSIAVDSFKASEATVQFFTENRTMCYRRSGAEVSQTDNLHFDTTGAPTLSVANPDLQTKSITLKNILSESSLERVYTVYALGLGRNDSLAMTNAGDNGLKLASYGAARDYNIRVEHASTTGLKVFDRTNISLPVNTTHTIAPEWGTLGNDLLTIFVDLGNDGSVDDTLHLTNEATGVQGHGSLIPREYRLEQNYPNPFNPVTTIRYGLPLRSAVRLTVYNVVGQEIATLVQEEQEAGYHEARFDGSGLASGVYIYRLQARSLRPAEGGTGTFVQSRKLLLLR